MYSPDALEQKVAETKGLLVYFKNDNCAPCLVLRPKVAKLVEQEFPKMELTRFMR